MSAKRAGMASVLLFGALACTQAPGITPITIAFGPLVVDTAFLSAVSDSRAVFFGTVLARPGRTTDAVELTPLTMIVRLDSAIVWDGAVTLATGGSLTVVARDSSHLSLTGKYGFLGRGIAIDTGLVIEETWRQDASTPASRSAFLNAYAIAVPAALDRETAGHLPEVDVVFWGPVTAVQPPLIPDSIKRKLRSESWPDWRVATVVPRRVLCGSASLVSQPTRVLFPGSHHIIYAAIPRPAFADVRLFLLHRPNRLVDFTFPGIDTAGVFVLFDPLDLRPASDTTRVTNLLLARPPVPPPPCNIP